jgi:pimeloyl-ACP methyl ester carboxylesterase
LDLSSYSKNISSLYDVVLKENLTYENALFLRQNFSGLEDSLSKKHKRFDEIRLEIYGLNKSIQSEIESYNNLLGSISYVHDRLIDFSSLKVEESSINGLDSFIDEYNRSVLEFFECGNLSYKEDIVFNLISSFKNLSLVFNESSSHSLSVSLPEFSFEALSFSFSSDNLSFSLESPPMLCCSFGKCDPCSSSNSSSNYPVLFVHGHGFNKEISVYSSLASMGRFQRELEKEGYFNAGNFISYNESSFGIFGKMNFPVSFSISYYVSLQNENGRDLIAELSTIDVYSHRLNDYIEGIKKVTGKEKVIIVSYSMGGLVSRRYLQLFGEDSVDRLILLAVPNFGVEGIVDRSCSVFGASEECNDLSVGSDFLEDLNSGSVPNLKVYNLIGEGCSIAGASGDGIVESKRAYIPFAINRYFFGSCEGVYFLHEKVLDPSIVPEAFDFIKRFIKE